MGGMPADDRVAATAFDRLRDARRSVADGDTSEPPVSAEAIAFAARVTDCLQADAAASVAEIRSLLADGPADRVHTREVLTSLVGAWSYPYTALPAWKIIERRADRFREGLAFSLRLLRSLWSSGDYEAADTLAARLERELSAETQRLVRLHDKTFYKRVYWREARLSLTRLLHLRARQRPPVAARSVRRPTRPGGRTSRRRLVGATRRGRGRRRGDDDHEADPDPRRRAATVLLLVAMLVGSAAFGHGMKRWQRTHTEVALAREFGHVRRLARGVGLAHLEQTWEHNVYAARLVRAIPVDDVQTIRLHKRLANDLTLATRLEHANENEKAAGIILGVCAYLVQENKRLESLRQQVRRAESQRINRVRLRHVLGASRSSLLRRERWKRQLGVLAPERKREARPLRALVRARVATTRAGPPREDDPDHDRGPGASPAWLGAEGIR
jgi:hypothetical protein